MTELEAPARLHHLAIGTPDVERLARFYREVFKLRECSRHLDEMGQLRSIWLDLGGPVLMLERAASLPRTVSGVGAGLFLIALRIAPAERSDLERELAARGLEVEARTAFTSYGRDLDGNRLAISHYPDV